MEQPASDSDSEEHNMARRGQKNAVGEVEPVEKSSLTGLAAVLQRLRETGELASKKHRQQTGRGKPLEIDEHDDGNNDGNGRDAGDDKQFKPQVNLAYVDEYGNELTPKEAFRMLCHKFHGNYPGKNKNEKRLLKILEERRLRELHDSGDTPLAAVAALRTETKRLRNAHVVLSGTEAFKSVPSRNNHSEADASEGANKTSNRKRHRDDARPPGEEQDARGTVAEEVEEKVLFNIGAPRTKAAKMRRRQ